MMIDEEELRYARKELRWAAYRARSHLVRLAKWRDKSVSPQPSDLSGAGTLVNFYGNKGILTAAHNIRCKFPSTQTSYIGATMDLVFGRLGNGPNVVGAPIDITSINIEGGNIEKGDAKNMGPDIAWIPLLPEAVSFAERHGKVFFQWKEDRFPNTTTTYDKNSQSMTRIPVGHLVTGYSGKREEAIAGHGPSILELMQDVYFPCDEWEKDGWDYEERVMEGPDANWKLTADSRLRQEVVSDIPLRVDHVGGLSGGGVWKFGGDSEKRFFDLSGLVWYQKWRNDKGEIRIVNHGRDSMRRIMSFK